MSAQTTNVCVCVSAASSFTSNLGAPEPSQLSGYIDTLYALLEGGNGPFGALDTSGDNPPNANTVLILNLLMKILADPSKGTQSAFLTDLQSGTGTYDKTLYNMLTFPDPSLSPPLSVEQMCTSGDIKDLSTALSTGTSYLNNAISIITNDYPAASVSYTYPGSTADQLALQNAFANLENLSSDFTNLQNFLQQGDNPDALAQAAIIANQLEAISKAAGDNPTDPLSSLLTNLLNSTMGSSTMTLQQFATDFNSTVSSPNIALLYNSSTPSDPSTGYNLLNSMGVVNMLSGLSTYVMQYMLNSQ